MIKLPIPLKRPSTVNIAGGVLILGVLLLGIIIGTLLLGSGKTKSYGPDAGFHPRDRTIGISPRVPVPALEAAMKYWNDAAQRPLFALGSGPITIYDGELVLGSEECHSGNCAAPVDTRGQVYYPFDYEYARCEVYLTDAGAANWPTVAHELGHCLGLDHDAKSIVGGGSRSGAYDRQQLQGLGYATSSPASSRARRTLPPQRTPRPYIRPTAPPRPTPRRH